jgi:XRE family transcriptional regulator, aerobic/anaerobic benzoate catabolism transcriptional regulator
MSRSLDSNKQTLEQRVGLPPEEEFLLGFGKRVREIRSRRGMTRKMVAQEAGVSERHLAQLEAGEGNISIVLLRRIAFALNVPLIDFFAADDGDPVGKRLIRHFLDQLPPHRLEEVMLRLLRDFGRQEKGRRTRIALIGLRGAGKSTLGSMLSRDLKIPFIEMDCEIAEEMGMPLEEIFSLYGQPGYRRIERRTLERLLKEHERAIFSIGGGVVSEKETYDYLLSHCYTVWVKARPEEHMSRVVAQGDFRAMAENDEAMEDLRAILEAREPFYQQADLHLDTSGETPEQSFAKLKTELQPNFQ